MDFPRLHRPSLHEAAAEIGYPEPGGITRTKEPGDKQPVYRNVDGYWRLGGEADLQLSLAADKSRWLENLKLIANVSYNHGGDTEVDDDPLRQLVPKLQANLGVTWTLLEHHTLGASQRLLSPRAAVGWQHITTLAYTFNYKAVELSVSLFNVAGSTIEDPDINSNQIPVVPGGPGRTIFGSAAYRF